MSYEELWAESDDSGRQESEVSIIADVLRAKSDTACPCRVTTLPDIEVASGANASLKSEFTPIDQLAERLSEYFIAAWTTPRELSEAVRHILSEGDEFDADWLTRIAEYADAAHAQTLVLLYDQPFGTFRRYFHPYSAQKTSPTRYMSAVNRQEIRPDGPSIDELLRQLLQEGVL